MGDTSTVSGGSGVWDARLSVQFDKLGLSEGQSKTLYVHSGHFDGTSKWYNSAGYKTVTVTRPRVFSASAAYDKADDSFTVSGRTVNSESSIQASDDGGSTWHEVGNASSYKYDLKVDRKYTSGTSIRVREGDSGTGTSVTTHSAALTDVSVGKTGNKRTLTAKASANAEVHVSESDIAADDYQVIKADSDGWVRNVELDGVPGNAKTATIWSGDKGARTEVNLPLALSANATDVNVEKGTANLQGFVPDGTNLLQVEWGSKTKTVTEFPDGMFQQALDDLALGSNPVKITALKGATELGTFSLDVDLRVEGLTAEATFDTENVERTVELRGTGTPNAKIEVRRGTKVVANETVGADGSWSGTVNPPNMTGIDTLDVVQVIRNQPNGTMELPVDYGIGTTITSPADGFHLEPGNDLVLKGVSQQNSLVRVFEKGKPANILGSTAADPDDGGWAIPVRDLEDREYKLVVATTSKGYNVTTTEITINPGKSSETRPLSVESPAAGSTTSSRTPYFMGWGQPGATITVEDTDGTEIGTTTVDENGWWGKVSTKTLSDGAHTFTVTQTAGSRVETVEREVTIDSIRDLTIESPTNGSTTWWPKPSFIGWGTPGADVVIKDEADTTIGTATINSEGWFGVESTKTLANGEHTLTFTQTANGATTSTTVGITIAHKPFQIDAPQDGGSSWWPNPSFIGWATPGAAVEVYDTDDTTLLARTTANDEGWFGVATDRALTYGEHTLHFRQSYNGATTATSTTYTIAADPLRIEQPTEGYQNWWPKPSFIGWATAGATVRITDTDGTLITTATANGEGWFGEISPKALSVGAHALHFQQVINGQQVGDPTTVNITITES